MVAVRSLPILVLAVCAALLAAAACDDSAEPAAEPVTESANESATESASGSASHQGSSAAAVPATRSDAEQDPSRLGPGFVVWESNRGGRWRIWRRDLTAAEPVALTPDEPGIAHCCAHLSPDGRRMVYLALPQGQVGYPRSGAAGELRLLDLDVGAQLPGKGKPLAARARTYFEHRAGLWHDDATFVHIDGEGRTVSRNVDSGAVKILIGESRPAHGWLVDRGLSFATQGAPTFSRFDAAAGRVRERPNLGGCQPYFAHHKALGVWVAGAGGPIRAIDLASGRQWPLIGKGDPRLPADRRYLYFPMPSRDGRRLAWAGSDGSHDHEKANYDVFVAETDPETLELLGAPWQVTHHRATDRFPDVWTEPLELGRFAGEAPFRVALKVPPSAAAGKTEAWVWDLGDGRSVRGASVDARWTEPGRYPLVARSGTAVLRGAVHVRPAAPPRLLKAEVRPSLDGTGAGEVWLRFDEAITTAAATATLQGGIGLESVGLRERDTAWVLRLERALERPDRLTLRGVADRAEPPNVLRETITVLTPPRWPSRRDGVVFLWQDGLHANRVVDPRTGQEETTVFEARGPAWLDRHGAAVLRGGSFEADMGTMERLLHGVRATNELTLEMTLTAASGATTRPSALFGFGSGGQRRNLTVAQEADRLTLRLNTPSSGQGGDQPVLDLGRVRAGEPQHLVVSYTPGRMRAFLDGEETADSRALNAGFFHWQLTNFRLGAEGPGEDGTGGWSWRGRLEGLAVYARAFEADEALENHRRYREMLRARSQVTSVRVRAALTARSRTPSLSEIAPYRDALAVFEYRIKEVLEGPVRSDAVLVVHRVLLDGRATAIESLRSGREIELTLRPFDAQPQLERLYLSDDLSAARPAGESGGVTLWWSDRIEP